MTEPASGPALDAAWRAERERAQELALPDGRVVVSCSAPLGNGGLGRHLREIVGALERRGSHTTCICGSDAPARCDLGLRAKAADGLAAALAPATRLSPPWHTWMDNVAFDLRAASRAPAAEHLIAFNGQALAQLRRAGREQMDSALLMSANSHLRRVVRLHGEALARHPLERSWATRLLGRNLAEYDRADRIYLASAHALESFVEEGVPEEKLSLFPLTPDPRFTPEQGTRTGGVFDVVYVGSLSVVKGVPLLIDAVRRLAHPDLRLVLVGGWGTRGMRRFVQDACASDARIRICRGDPLPHLRRAALCVHPSWEDGFGYAPVEALCCGVPAIVSENTGMKELIVSGSNGMVLPTGDLDALAEAIDSAYRGELLSG